MKNFGFPLFIPRGHGGPAGMAGIFCHRPTLAHVGAGDAGMIEEQMIELGAVDLKGGGLTGKAAVAKSQLERLAGIAEMKLGAKFCGEPSGLQSGQNAHLLEKSMIVRQQRFTYMKARKAFLLQDQNSFSSAGQTRRRSASARSATDNHRV